MKLYVYSISKNKENYYFNGISYVMPDYTIQPRKLRVPAELVREDELDKFPIVLEYSLKKGVGVDSLIIKH